MRSMQLKPLAMLLAGKVFMGRSRKCLSQVEQCVLITFPLLTTVMLMAGPKCLDAHASLQFGLYEWCMTDSYDKSNPEHRKISHGIEIGDGIAEMRTIAQARSALKAVGFEILVEKDLAAQGDKIPWFYPLRGNMSECQTLWDYATVIRMTWFGKLVTQSTVKLLEKIGMAHPGTFEVGEALKVAADALVAGGETGLFTPMMLVGVFQTNYFCLHQSHCLLSSFLTGVSVYLQEATRLNVSRMQLRSPH